MTGRSAVAARMTRFTATLPRDEVGRCQNCCVIKLVTTRVLADDLIISMGPGDRAGGEVLALLKKHDLRTFSERVDFLRTAPTGCRIPR